MHRALLALLAACSTACSQRSSDRVVPVEVASLVATPAARDVGRDCADVGDFRTCWGDLPGAVHGVVSVPRPVPTARAARRGWRCSGKGETRVCEDRALGSDAFECDSGVCKQRMPRMPDDGEWECADSHGVVVCHGGAPAAGTVAGPRAVGFVCGPRRGKSGERVCIDFSPDRPAGHEDCRFESGRTCRKGVAAIGGTCGSCPAGSVCASGRCLPLEPRPECWLDKDCGHGVCLFGTCRGGAP